MTLHQIWTRGLTNIWNKHSNTQETFLKLIEEQRGMPGNVLKKYKAIFVPNDTYLANTMGVEIRQEHFGCYVLESNLCYWTKNLVFPIYNVVDEIVGLVGFNPFTYLESKETGYKDSNYYSYSNKKVFSKGKYLFYTTGTYDRALADDYLFIVDGFFDAISLTEAGFHAAAFLSSSTSEELIMQLKFIKRIFLLVDNDKAGQSLYKRLRKHLNNLTIVKQGKTKDIDELLKSKYREETISQLHNIVKDTYKPIAIVNF